MASIREDIHSTARPDQVWATVRDIGALHTRLVPGFVTDTRLEPGARIVTFGNGMVVREAIVDLDEENCRLVWSAAGGSLSHHNASAQVFAEGEGSRVVWIADFLPDAAAGPIGAMMAEGAAIMKRTLDAAASRAELSP